MARISVKDLPRSDALDRRALQAVVGGARSGARAPLPASSAAGHGRIVDYPPGFGSGRQPPSDEASDDAKR